MSTAPGQPRPTTGPRGSRGTDVAAFLAGAIAALLAVAVGEVFAGFIPGAPSLVTAVGDLVIELQPPGAKELVVSLFGTNDKVALQVGIVLVATLLAGLLGVAGRRRFGVAVAGFAAAGILGLLAAIRQPLTEPLLAVITVVVAITAALVALRAMLLATRPAWAPPVPSAAVTPSAASDAAPAASTAAMPDWDRRRFLALGGGITLGSLALAAFGRLRLGEQAVGPVAGQVLPLPADAAPSLPPGASLPVPGITPIVVPNPDFYRIDTALITPRVDAATWSLAVKGMVEREVTMTYDDLLAMPQLEQYVTIACVSNEVGGDLVGNALWSGVDLRAVLGMAGVRPGATQIVGRSVDGFTAGFPTAWAMDATRQPMIALGMNGVPLPADHGYPARLIIPGLYGYVSATKWLAEIELTTWEAFDGYWVPLGWAKEAPILTQSRIDVPRPRTRLAAGAQPVAGVAWAPDRGVSRVEVRIDDGPWQPATLSQPLADAAWVQWLLTWEATPGAHTIAVRATDGEGVVQPEQRTRPAPDGARGYHTIAVDVA